MDLFQKRERQLQRDYRYLFNTEEGKRVLEDLMRRFHAMDSTLVEGDPCGTHHAEGERNVVLYILAKMRYGALDYQGLVDRMPVVYEETEDTLDMET